MKNKLWGGRFKKKTNPLVEEFTRSLHFDKAFAEFDCIGGIAHVEMLGKCRIISKNDSRRIVSGLNAVLKEIRKGQFRCASSGEDIHTVIQNALYKKIGKVASKLHTARSRNDQVALDTRMYCKKEIGLIIDDIRRFKKSIVAFAEKNIDVIVPGFTHLQNAQPVLLSHQMMAYCEMLDRDTGRLVDCRKRMDVLPLGSGALSGTGLAIDRMYVAKKLGFRDVSPNSMDAVSDRDFVLELVFSLSVIAMHLSRLSEDLIILNSQAIGILEISDNIATGSSMMPHKKNPDVLELVRGKAGECYGSLVSVLTLMKGLPLTYNRDMQQDKEPLFRAINIVRGCLKVLALFFKSLNVDRKKADSLLNDESLYATDIMEYLIKKGISHRAAHEAIGKIIVYCADRGVRISEVSLDKLRSFCREFNKDVYDLLDAKMSVGLKDSYGGTNPAQVRRQIKNARF